MKPKIMTKDRLKKMIRLGVEQFTDPYYQGVAAQLAFYLFLSIIPTFILLSQVLGVFSLSLTELQDWLGINVSGEGVDTLQTMLNYRPSGANSLFLVVTALWAASRAQFSLIRVTNYTLTDGKTTGAGYIRDRLHSMKTILITLITISFSLIVIVYGELILKVAFGTVTGNQIAEAAWVGLRWPMAFALYFLMISYNYYALPTQKVRYRDIVPGSIFSAVGIMVVTFFYMIYTNISSNYDILYGSFSNIVVLLFWLWFISWVLCLGITVNRVWWATRASKAIPIAEEAKTRRKSMNIF